MLIVCAAQRVQAQADDATRAAARSLGEQGIQAFRAGDYVTADAKLDKAYQLFSTPTLGLWGARARVKLGHWVEAAERFRDAVRTSDAVGNSAAQKEAQRDAAKELQALSPLIPTVTIQIENAAPEEVAITIDDVPVASGMIGVPRPTNPGSHRVVATRGGERREAVVRLQEKSQENLLLSFRKVVAQKPAAAAPVEDAPEPARADVGPFGESTQPTAAAPAAPAPEARSGSSALEPIAIVVMSVGVAGLATGGVTALLANGKLDQCPNHQCESQSVKDSYDTLKTISTISIYAGAALAVGGLVTFLLAPGEDQEPAVSWGVSPTGVAVSGRF